MNPTQSHTIIPHNYLTLDDQVTVGSTVCGSPTVSATQITCTLNNTVLAGSRKVNVNISPLGYASGAPSTTVQVEKALL